MSRPVLFTAVVIATVLIPMKPGIAGYILISYCFGNGTDGINASGTYGGGDVAHIDSMQFKVVNVGGTFLKNVDANFSSGSWSASAAPIPNDTYNCEAKMAYTNPDGDPYLVFDTKDGVGSP